MARARIIGGNQVEGSRSVEELIRAGRRRVEVLYVEDEFRQGELAELASDAGIRVMVVGRDGITSRAGSRQPQGVVAIAEPIPVSSLEEVAGAPGPLLVLDRIQDPNNLGAILRSAAAAGVSGVVLPEHRAAGLSPTVAKIASGALEYLSFAVVGGVPAALSAIGRLGRWRVGLDAGGSHSLFGLELEADRVALVVGSEGSGLSNLVRLRCDVLAAIPMAGTVASLNASVAAGIALFALVEGRVRS